MVGSAQRIQAAARHQPAAPRLYRPPRRPGREDRAGCRLRRRHPVGKYGWIGRGCQRHRPVRQGAASRQTAPAGKRQARRLPQDCRGRIGRRTAWPLRCRHLHGNARACTRPAKRGIGLRETGQTGRMGILLHTQPQPEILSVRCGRCGICAQPAAARHARLRQIHQTLRTGAVLSQCRPEYCGHYRHELQPVQQGVFAGQRYGRELHDRLSCSEDGRQMTEGRMLSGCATPLSNNCRVAATKPLSSDETTSHSTRLSKDNSQVAGYVLCPLSSVNAVLFYLDGTFADTAPDLAAALNHTRAARNLPPLPLEVIRPQASPGSRGLLKLAFDIEPDAPGYDTLRDLFLDYYERNICVHTQLFGDMAELVAELERRNIKWGIVTNKQHRYTVPLMQALGYAGRAACLISGDTCE